MKRMTLISLVSVLLVLFGGSALAASSCTAKAYEAGGDIVVELAWTAHTDGSFTDYAIPANILTMIRGKRAHLGITDPGGTAPTTLYDITIDDALGADIFGGALGDRSATATEQTTPLVNGISRTRLVYTSLTLTISNNSVNAATGIIVIIFSD